MVVHAVTVSSSDSLGLPGLAPWQSTHPSSSSSLTGHLTLLQSLLNLLPPGHSRYTLANANKTNLLSRQLTLQLRSSSHPQPPSSAPTPTMHLVALAPLLGGLATGLAARDPASRTRNTFSLDLGESRGPKPNFVREWHAAQAKWGQHVSDIDPAFMLAEDGMHAPDTV